MVSLALSAVGFVANELGLTANVAFYDQEDMRRIFYGLPLFSSEPMSAGYNRNQDICEHPIEDGSVIADFAVKQPKTFSCALALPFIALPASVNPVIKELQQYYLECKKIIVQTPTGVMFDMVLTALPSNITPENASRPVIDLSFKEVKTVVPLSLGGDNVENPEDSNTQESYGVLGKTIIGSRGVMA